MCLDAEHAISYVRTTLNKSGYYRWMYCAERVRNRPTGLARNLIPQIVTRCIFFDTFKLHPDSPPTRDGKSENPSPAPITLRRWARSTLEPDDSLSCLSFLFCGVTYCVRRAIPRGVRLNREAREAMLLVVLGFQGMEAQTPGRARSTKSLVSKCHPQLHRTLAMRII